MSSNNTIGPPNCSSHIGLPELPYPSSCGLPLYQHWNATQDPYTTLLGCCPSAQNVGYFGADLCYAYCNATRETQSDLQGCLSTSRQISEFGCSSGAGRAVDGRGWAVYVVFGLLVWTLLYWY